MQREFLDVYKNNLSILSDEEKILRLEYIKDFNDGIFFGPMTGYASIDMPWLRYYDKKKIIQRKELYTCYDMVKKENENYLDETAINFANRSISFKELLNEVDSISRSLAACNIKKGDVVTVISACVPESIYIFYAINRFGGCANFIDPRIKNDEIVDAIRESSSKLVFCLDIRLRMELAEEIEKINNVERIIAFSPVQSLSWVIRKIAALKSKTKRINHCLVLYWNDFIKGGVNQTITESDFEPESPAIMVRTGGTTGKPKTVILTNENMNEMAFQHKIGDYNFKRQDKFLNFLPPFYAYGICAATHMPLVLGLIDIMIPTFDSDDFPGLMKKHQPNVVFGGPILYEKLMGDSKVGDIDLSNFTVPVSGGDSMSIEVERKVNKFIFEHGGKHHVGQGYGMTEVASSVCYSKENSYIEGSVGIPLIHNQIAIFDSDTMEENVVYEQGEICIKTGTMMLGYLNNRYETDKVIKTHSDGTRWVHTGDIGYMNESGSLFIKGRIKRMIVSNGSKIFPSEIENIISRNPNIDICVVVGSAHPVYRKVPVAYIVLKNDGADIEKEILAIVDDIKSSLPDYYVPASFVIKDHLPVSNVNKILYNELEDELTDYERLIVDKRTSNS